MKQLLLLSIFASTFMVHSQTWEELSPFPGAPRDDGASFVIGDKAYCGTGRNAGFAVTSDFFVFDGSSGQWASVTPMPASTERQYAVGFEYGNYGYIFGGIDAQGGYLSDLWGYNPVTNDWADLGNAPFEGRSGMQAFVVQDTVYIVGGRTATSSAINEVWAYSFFSGQWEQKSDLPGDGIWRGFGCSYMNTGIVGFGVDSTDTRRGEIYFYHADTDSWEEITQLNATPRSYPATAIRDDRLFVYGGEPGSGGYSNDFEYINLTDSTWHSLTSFPSTARRGAMAFVLNDDFYLTTGITTTERLNETWVARSVLEVPFFDWLEEFTWVSDGMLHCHLKWNSCKLLDVSGRDIELVQISEGIFRIPNDLATGAYMVYMFNDTDYFSSRVFVE